MTEPGPSREQFDHVRATLLRSAKHDAPSPRAVRRTMGALGLGAALAADAGQAAAAATHVATVGLWKWVGAGILAGISTLGVYQAVAPKSPRQLSAVAAPASPTRPAAPRGAQQRPVQQDFAAADSADPLPSPAPSAETPQTREHPGKPADTGAQLESEPSMDVAPSASAPPRTALDQEVAALDEARRALERGDSAACLRALDRYASEFKTPQLGLEASVLRVQALVARGDCAGARSLAGPLLQRSPDGPAGQRVRSLLQAGCSGGVGQ